MANIKTAVKKANIASVHSDLADDLLVERDGAVAILSLNRPQAANALSENLIAELHKNIDLCAQDRAIRSIIIAAKGSVFCAGHDLRQLQRHRNDTDHGRKYYRKIFDHCSAMMQAIVACPKPVIAQIDGVATAAGCQLIASCDLAYATNHARFGVPGVKIGLFCSTPMVALSRNVSQKHAMEMLLEGNLLGGEDAVRIGLINRVFATKDFCPQVKAIAARIGGHSAHVLKIGKQAFYRQKEMSLQDAYAYTGQVMAENMLAEDSAIGITAFLEKKTPHWQDR